MRYGYYLFCFVIFLFIYYQIYLFKITFTPKQTDRFNKEIISEITDIPTTTTTPPTIPKPNLRTEAPNIIEPTKVSFQSQIPLYGNRDIGYYYTTLYIGSPPQKFSVIIDTGSSVVSVPCSGCDCGRHLNSQYNLKMSKNGKIVSCPNKLEIPRSLCKNNVEQYSQSYGEGSSYIGKFIMDLVSFQDGSHANNFGFQFPFGCHSSERGLFRSQLADGILGLAPKHNTFIDYLMKSGLPNKIFTICVAEIGGYSTVGGIATFNHKGPILYTPYGRDYFYFSISNILLDNMPIVQNINRIMIDSGSSLSYFRSDIVNTITTQLTNYCRLKHCSGQPINNSNKERFCWKYPDLSTFPNLELAIGNEKIVIEADNYMWSPHGRKNKMKVCLGIYTLSKNIFGNNFMKDHEIIFNFEKGAVGFAQSNCNAPIRQ